MSLLNQILSSAEKMEVDKIKTKSSEVTVHVDKIKRNLLSYLENVYVRFSDRPKKNKTLVNQIGSLQEELTSLLSNAEEVLGNDLRKGEQEFQNTYDALCQTNTALILIDRVNRIHESLTEIRRLEKDRFYLDCIRKINCTEDFMNSLNAAENLPVLEKFAVEVSNRKTFLLATLTQAFNDAVIFDESGDRCILKIRTKTDELIEVLEALSVCRSSIDALDNITQFLWNCMLKPIIDCKTAIQVKAESDYHILEVEIINQTERISHEEVFDKLVILIEFLLSRFNFPLSEGLSTLEYIGNSIECDLSDYIIKNCLKHTIPTSHEALQQYNTVIDSTEKLEEILLASNIFSERNTSLRDFVKNADADFINNRCKEYMNEAQQLMKLDLHDMVEVGKKEEANLDEVPAFPASSISRNVLSIIQLLEKILKEASSSSNGLTKHLFQSVKNICHMYVTFVPEHHKRLLQTIPQQIALFYNNCMYLSHQLTQWNESYLQQLPSMNSFDDQERNIREVATKMFTSYIEQQINQIHEIMAEAGLQGQSLDKVDSSTGKSLRQCLRQQELLKTVWHKVLPYSLYNKTVGNIFDSLCNNIINSIVKFEDISSDAAENLVDLLKMVQTRGPKLFTDPKEVGLFVTSWFRLNELVSILNGTLVDINDRWADGKGPLAVQFKPEEVRQLVKGLFQNTERRAMLLAKIHE